MAQQILRDSGLLVDIGEAVDFRDFDTKYHQIVDTGQTFHEFRAPKREVWFYCPATDKFYQSNRKRHGLLNAVHSQFADQERWNEIEDVLEEHGIDDLLNVLNITRLRRKLLKAQRLGKITVDERQTILAVFDHLEVTV